MFAKPEAIEYLRSTNLLNHEPVRNIEQDWLDRRFLRERMSKAWIGMATVLSSAEEQGIHIDEDRPVPCNCLDWVGRNRSNAR